MNSLRLEGTAPEKAAPPARSDGAAIWHQAYVQVKARLTPEDLAWWPDFKHLIITAIDAALAAVSNNNPPTLYSQGYVAALQAALQILDEHPYVGGAREAIQQLIAIAEERAPPRAG